MGERRRRSESHLKNLTNPAHQVRCTGYMSSTNRPRIIPTKRPLLSPRLSSQFSVNYSSKPADIQFRKPAFSSLPTSSSSDKDAGRDVREGQQEKDPPVTIECDFSRVPQPFLDPELWGTMRRQEQELAQGQEQRPSGDPEERDRRRERDAEYGRFAIRSRTARRRVG